MSYWSSELAQYGFIKSTNVMLSSWTDIFFHGLKTASIAVIQLACVIFPLMLIMQFFRELGWLDILSNWCAPFTKFLGMRENTTFTLVTGLTIGLAFGAGVMIQAVEEDDRKSTRLNSSHVAISYAVFCLKK